jgi:hypothetical protein
MWRSEELEIEADSKHRLQFLEILDKPQSESESQSARSRRVNRCVLDYLLREGYRESASALMSAMGTLEVGFAPGVGLELHLRRLCAGSD